MKSQWKFAGLGALYGAAAVLLLWASGAPTPVARAQGGGTITGIPYGLSLPINCLPNAPGQQNPLFYLAVQQGAYAPGLYACTVYGTWAAAAGANNLNVASLNNVLYVGSNPGQYAGLQAAHDALPAGGGTIKIVPGYQDTETSTISITKNHVSILCEKTLSFTNNSLPIISVNHTGVGFNITGQNFGINGCEVRASTASSRAGVPLFDSNTTVGGRLSNIFVGGNGSSPNNGTFFRSTDTNARQGLWQLDNIIHRDGTTWTSLITVSIASASLTGAYYKFTDIVNSYSEKYTDAAIVLDGTIDTVEMDRISTGNTQTNGHNIWLRNTVSASGLGYPRWVHCDNCYPEAGGNIGGTILQVDSGRDVDFTGYMASATNCVNQTNALVGVNIHDIAFTNIFGTCIVVTGGTGTTIHHGNFSDLQQGAISYAGGGGIIVDGCTFYNSGLQTTNTYDTISIAANTGTVQITNNSWLNQGTPKPRYGVNFLGGVSNAVVNGNNYAGATFGTSFLNPPSAGSNIQILGQETSVLNRLMGYSLLGPVTVGALPAAAAGNKGQMISVSDSTAVAAEGQTCVGGSTNTALAFSNGTAWKCF